MLQSEILKSQEHKDWSEKIDNDRKAFREQRERDRLSEEQNKNQVLSDILHNGNWEKYIHGNDIYDFLNEYGYPKIIETLFSDKEIVKKLIKKYRIEAKYILNCPEHLQADEEIGLMLVQKDGQALQFLHDTLQNNKNVVFTACENSCTAYEYASDELKLDKKFALRVIDRSTHGDCIYDLLPDILKGDKECALKAIEKDATAEYDITHVLMDDSDVIAAFEKYVKK